MAKYATKSEMPGYIAEGIYETVHLNVTLSYDVDDGIPSSLSYIAGASIYIDGKCSESLRVQNGVLGGTVKPYAYVPIGVEYMVVFDYFSSNGLDAEFPSSQTYVATMTGNTREVTGNYKVCAYKDISLIDVTGGTIERETANCYVIPNDEEGWYRIPLIYGAAYKNGQPNPSAYTRPSTNESNTQPYYNYKGQQITSPFIETDTNTQAVSAVILYCDSSEISFYEPGQSAETIPGDSGTTVYSYNFCKYVRFHIQSAGLGYGGNAIIAVKDASGTIMWTWHIWCPPSNLSTISYTNTNNKTYEFLNYNLGFVSDSYHGKYGTSPFYQWGRKDPFLRSGATSGTFSSANTASSLAQTIQNPTVFNIGSSTYSYSWWINNSAAPTYYNYWDSETSTTGTSDKVTAKTVYDPCPPGFAVPCGNAFLGFSTSNGGTWDSGFTFNGSYFPAIGYRNYNNGSIANSGTDGHFLTISSNSARYKYSLFINSTTVTPQGYSRYYTSYGYAIRPVKIS